MIVTELLVLLGVDDEASEAALAWRSRANCRGVDPELFFPARGEHRARDEARVVCRACTVSAECLDYALVTSQRFGIWGGLTELERKKIRVGRRRGAA